MFRYSIYIYIYILDFRLCKILIINFILFKLVYDWDKDTESDYIGGFEATFEDIKSKKEFDLVNDKDKKKDKKKDDKKPGTLAFNRIEIREDLSFSCFTLGGTEFAVDFAIDFTNSNGKLISN